MPTKDTPKIDEKWFSATDEEMRELIRDCFPKKAKPAEPKCERCGAFAAMNCSIEGCPNRPPTTEPAESEGKRTYSCKRCWDYGWYEGENGERVTCDHCVCLSWARRSGEMHLAHHPRCPASPTAPPAESVEDAKGRIEKYGNYILDSLT